MAELPFWDEDLLTGSIEPQSLHTQHNSLFETNLFCNEPLDPTITETDLPLTASLTPSFSTPVPPLALLTAPSPFPPNPSTPSSLPACPALTNDLNLLTPPPKESSRWSSFMDDNCPLRRRVKVTITPHSRSKRTAAPPPRTPSPPPKRRRATPSRRLQTTLHFSRPGEPARVQLCLPSRLTPASARRRPNCSPKLQRQIQKRDSPLTPPPMRARVVGMPHASQDASNSRSCISTALAERIQAAAERSLQPTSPVTPCLPLADAAVMAVTRAAEAYSNALSRPPTSCAPQSPLWPVIAQRKVKKRGRGRKRASRTLLSFDDHDVAPLRDPKMEGLDTSEERRSALMDYLNSPSAHKQVLR